MLICAENKLIMETIRGIGKFNEINQIGDGLGRRKASEFLNRLIREFAKQSAKYIIATSEAPFAHRERQLHSIFAPAISKITPAFLMEQPIERQWKEKESMQDMYNYTGWLDYWCRYRDVDFFIELKHNYHSYKNRGIPEKIKKNLEYVNNDQLKKVEDEAIRYSKNCKGVLLTSLHVITIYEYHKKSNEIESIDDFVTLLNIQNELFNNLDPTPSWCGLWVPNNQLIEKSFSKTDSHNEYYPGVILISKVHEIIL